MKNLTVFGLYINENPEEQTKASFRRKSTKKAKIIEKNEYGLKSFISDEHITKKESHKTDFPFLVLDIFYAPTAAGTFSDLFFSFSSSLLRFSLATASISLILFS